MRHHKKVVILLLFFGFFLGAVWRFTALHNRFGLTTLVNWGSKIQGHPWTPYGVVLIFVLGGLIFFGHAVLLWATVFTFDLPHAIAYAAMGSLASAVTLYGL